MVVNHQNLADKISAEMDEKLKSIDPVDLKASSPTEVK
jgi:hypothetical protein